MIVHSIHIVQVNDLLEGCENSGFVDVRVEELLLRSYKPIIHRLRPDDVMFAHTVCNDAPLGFHSVYCVS